MVLLQQPADEADDDDDDDDDIAWLLRVYTWTGVMDLQAVQDDHGGPISDCNDIRAFSAIACLQHVAHNYNAVVQIYR